MAKAPETSSKHRQSGHSVVEVALMVPCLILLLLGLMNIASWLNVLSSGSTRFHF